MRANWQNALACGLSDWQAHAAGFATEFHADAARMDETPNRVPILPAGRQVWKQQVYVWGGKVAIWSLS